MKLKHCKRILSVLLSISMVAGLIPGLPGMALKAFAAEPSAAQFATKTQLQSSFGLNTGDTAARINFGASDRKWLIAGADGTDTLALLSTTSFGNSIFNPDGASALYGDDNDLSRTSTVKGYLSGCESNTYFSASELALMKDTSVSTVLPASSTYVGVTGKLYLPDANDAYAVGSTTIYIGGSTNIPIALSNLSTENGFSVNTFFWLRTYCAPYSDRALGVWTNPDTLEKMVSGSDVKNSSSVLPAFNLNLSSVLFGSVAPAAAAEGSLLQDDAYTLRYESSSLGSASINPAGTIISVSGAPEGTYLVVQNDSGAWAKSVSGSATLSPSQIDSGLSSFDHCKVWLEKTDTTERISAATMAVELPSCDVTITSGSNMTKTADSGAASQTGLTGAMTDVVYTADSGYYLPTDYNSDDSLNANGITVTRDSYTQITVSGTPTANASITLMAATEKGTQSAPIGLSNGVDKIAGTTTEMEYASSAAAISWNACTDSNTTVAAGTWYVRYKETDTKKAGATIAVTVMALSGSSTPNYTVTFGLNGSEINIPITVDTNTGRALIDVSSQNNLISGGGNTVIAIPPISGVATYALSLSVSSLSSSANQGTLTIETNTGSITIPSNMLTGIAGANGTKAEITIGQSDKSHLPEAVKAAIGDRPLIQLSMSIDGTQTEWNNPDAPVTVSIPYTPTEEELADPEHIVVWYIDGSGNVVSIPSGHYDASTGTVVFSTTHFSDYAVAYDPVIRLAGENRIETALTIAKATYPHKISSAILVTAGNYPDALTGSVLAYQLDAPILLVGSSDADQKKVLDYLETHLEQEGTVYILGGTGVVTSSFADKLNAYGIKQIKRLDGNDRYGTSVQIVEQLNVKAGTPVVLVSGENYPDALSVSSIAAQNGFPIFLVQKDGISDAITQKIASIKPDKVYIIGQQGAISQNMENQVARITGLAAENIIRIGGTDRYATSLAIAQYFNRDSQAVCIATGNNFPDALAGGVYAAKHQAPIILTGGSLSEQTVNYLASGILSKTAIFGGEGVVGKDVEMQVKQLVKK